MKHSLYFLLIFMCSVMQGQQSITVIPPSPDASALAVYGSIPVSTYTGVPNINIPIHTISYRDVQIPISLSYHASGITVEQDASWVGLSWALNVGGIITRTVRGGDDLQFSNDGYSNLGSPGLDYRGYPYDAFDNTPLFLANVCNKQLDAEPDVFYFNFLGNTGGFVLEKGQNPTSNELVGTPLKMEKIDIRYLKDTKTWIVRTPDGYSYYFNTVEPTETLHAPGVYGQGPERAIFDPSSHGFYSWDDIAISSWYLDKTVSPLGEVVNYVYDVEDIAAAPGTKNSRYGSAKLSVSDFKSTSLDPLMVPGRDCYINPNQTSVTKTFTNHIYLKEINYSLGKIVFNKSLRDDMIPTTSNLNTYSYLTVRPYFLTWLSDQYGPQKLDNIVFLDYLGNVIKKFEFKYGYYNEQSTGSDKYSFKRLRLDEVKECGATTCNPPFKLIYDESNPLPSKYSNAQDFWGYYNGAMSNVSRIPFGTFLNPTDNKYYFLGDADRQPNSNYMKAGILNKIIYPTGGMTEFEFEPHSYYLFGNDAFTLTDFENNTPVDNIGLITNQADESEFKTITFTISGANQEITLKTAMTYYASATTSTPCEVTDPGTIYAGNEVWYTLLNTTSSSSVTSHYMRDFLSFFTSNYNSYCTTPYNPEGIDPILRKEDRIVLEPGTYELKLYRRQGFNLTADISRTIISPRVIQRDANGIFQKTAGGLRIKRITSTADASAKPLVKKYDYTFTTSQTEPRTSTGRLMLYPNYHVYYHCTGGDHPLVAIIGSSWPSTPLGTSASGSAVGYDKIIESAGEDYTNGWTEYFYLNQEEEAVDYSTVFVTGLPTRKRSSNGLLREERQYNKNREPVIIRSTVYGLPQFPKQIKGIATAQIITINRNPPNYTPSLTCDERGRKMVSQEYSVISDRWVPMRKTERIYQDATKFLESSTEFVYDTKTHLQLTSQETTSSTGEVIRNEFVYPPEASWIPVETWKDKFIYNKVVEKKAFKNNALINSYKTYLAPAAGTYLVKKEESSVSTAPVEVLNDFSYSSNGNIQSISKRSGVVNEYIWDYKNSYPIAETVNPSGGTTAFTSFEANGTGNWTIASTARNTTTFLTGNKSYSLSSGSIVKTGLVTGMDYVVSYWTNSASAAVVKANGIGVAAILLFSTNGWRCYQHILPNNTTSVSISGTNIIDELRLHPREAQMTSYTYAPLVGLTSANSSSNNVSIYEYDDMKRLSLIRDLDRNILKKIDYKYQVRSDQ